MNGKDAFHRVPEIAYSLAEQIVRDGVESVLTRFNGKS